MSSVPSNVNQLEPYFQQRLKKGVTLNEDEVKAANCRLQNVLLNKMQSGMKSTDDTFKELYKQPHYVDSFYENLRVAHPNEFDINLELQLPMNDSDIQIDTKGTSPGFAKIKVDKKFHDRTSETVKKKIESWCENNYLCRDKVFQWLQGIVDRVLRNVEWPQNMTVRRNTNGPAVTLIVTENKNEFSVDLVPVFTFGTSRWPPPPLRQLKNLPRKIDTSVKWCVVPKSPRQDSASRQQWRMSFYMHEKQLMNDLNNMKPVIKLMKLLRDKENWVALSSYYIKTLFMWEQEVQSHVPGFWRNGISYLFMHMLGKLESYLQSEEIPFFWDRRSNLIEHLGWAEIENMRCRVKHIRQKLERALSSPGQDLSSVVDELFTVRASRRETDCQPQELQQAEPFNWATVVTPLAVGVTATAAFLAFRNWRSRNSD